jgi:acyl carrier protein
MNKGVENKIKYIMSSVFGIHKNEIHDNVSPDTVESWDSLKHMDLIVSLEEEFEIEFSDEEIIKMMNYKSIREITCIQVHAK